MLSGMNLYIRLNTLSFKVPIFGYFTIPYHTSKTHTCIHLSHFLTIFNMFLTIFQANASTTAMTNMTPAGSDMSLKSLVYIGPNELPLPKLNTIILDNPDDNGPFILSPPPLTPKCPAAIHIQQDVYQEVHTTKEGKPHADAVEGLLKLKGLNPHLAAATVRQCKEEA
jgi:hypothetical protein